MPEKLSERISELQSNLIAVNPQQLAMCTGAEVDQGTRNLNLVFLDRQISCGFPELIFFDKETSIVLPDSIQALLLYYLTTADGTPLSGRWISFASLPDGRFYNKAFQGYSGDELAKYFGNDLDSFECAGIRLKGVKIAYGDRAFAFHILPRFMISIIFHLGDEDFPSSCQILFDESSHHYLPTDACAVVGSMITKKMVKSN